MWLEDSFEKKTQKKSQNFFLLSFKLSRQICWANEERFICGEQKWQKDKRTKNTNTKKIQNEMSAAAWVSSFRGNFIKILSALSPTSDYYSHLEREWNLNEGELSNLTIGKRPLLLWNVVVGPKLNVQGRILLAGRRRTILQGCKYLLRQIFSLQFWSSLILPEQHSTRNCEIEEILWKVCIF